MKKLCFIINPIAGTNKKEKIEDLVYKVIDHKKWEVEIAYTQYAHHATELAREKANQNYGGVVAVGGDGTLNEVASGLINTNTALGIIPMGSGNGFARHLGIPVNPTRALEVLNKSEVVQVDYGLVNEIPFFSTCGTGFDATIAEHFATKGTRGLMTYLTTILQDYFTYKAEDYTLTGDYIDLKTKAFLISFANAGQWGYEAKIAPKASIQDGMMDIVIMSDFPMVVAPLLDLSLYSKQLDKLYMHTIRVPEITLIRKEEGPFHIDGDPHHLPKELHIKIVENGLKLLVKRRF